MVTASSEGRGAAGKIHAKAFQLQLEPNRGRVAGLKALRERLTRRDGIIHHVVPMDDLLVSVSHVVHK